MTADQREGLTPPIDFKQALIETTFKPGRVYEGPDEIDLGVFQPDLEELIDNTLSDPRHREFGRIIYVSSDNKVITNKEPIQGAEKEVKIVQRVAYLNVYSPDLERRYRQDRFIGGHIHSHPIDQVPTPPDLVYLMIGDEHPIAHTAGLLITPNRKIAVFRGKNTPQWTLDESQEKARVLVDALLRRAESFPGMLYGGGKEHLSILLVRAMFRQFATKYGLQVFESGARDRVLKRIQADRVGADLV